MEAIIPFLAILAWPLAAVLFIAGLYFWIRKHASTKIAVATVGPATVAATTPPPPAPVLAAPSVLLENEHGHAGCVVIEGINARLEVIAATEGAIRTFIRTFAGHEDDIAVTRKGTRLVIEPREGLADDASVRADVALFVPHGTALKIKGVQGEVIIGDTHGYVDVLAHEGGYVQIGTVCDASLQVDGYGRIEAAEVRDSLRMSLKGRGEITVHRGSVHSLNVQVSGPGDLNYYGRAVEARLSAEDQGEIYVEHVERAPKVTMTDGGDVTVQNWD